MTRGSDECFEAVWKATDLVGDVCDVVLGMTESMNGLLRTYHIPYTDPKQYWDERQLHKSVGLVTPQLFDLVGEYVNEHVPTEAAPKEFSILIGRHTD